MAAFLKTLRSIGGALCLIGMVGMLIFWMNDIGTDAPIAIFAAVALAGAALNLALLPLQRAAEKRKTE